MDLSTESLAGQMRESIAKSDKGPNLSFPLHGMEEKKYVSPSRKMKNIEKFDQYSLSRVIVFLPT